MPNSIFNFLNRFLSRFGLCIDSNQPLSLWQAMQHKDFRKELYIHEDEVIEKFIRRYKLKDYVDHYDRHVLGTEPIRFASEHVDWERSQKVATREKQSKVSICSLH